MESVGKEIGDNVYVHLAAISRCRTAADQELVHRALSLLPNDVQGRPNVAKINLRMQRVSLLEYAEFELDAFPVLKSSWTMTSSIATALHYRSYEQSSNPPILHRKELLVQHDHPKVSEWAATTETCEALGLFDDPKTIGFLLNWERTIASKGFTLVGSNFLPLGNEVEAIPIKEFPENDAPSINRHLTAMTRSSLSAPVQMLMRNGLIKRESQFFDYGCGRGDDIASLKESGYIAAGWDPHFAPDHQIPDKAHAVNLGFVVNVIEDPAERVETLIRAFHMTSGVMSIGVMLYGHERGGKSFRDGVLTSRGTFQKYFSQDEFKDYLEQVLHQEAFMVAPGIAFVFADKELEQQYLASKYRSRGIEQRLVVRSRRHIARDKYVRSPRTSANERRLELVRPILDEIWRASLALGRYPTEDELPKQISNNCSAPTLRRALRLIQTNYPMEFLAKARESRKADLQLYFATQQFSRRPRYRQLETRLQKDIVEFFGDYHSSQAAGLQLLKDASNPEKILLACREAAEMGLGWLEEEHSLQVHVDLVDSLPVLLRAYIACATLLTEGLSDADLVKIHVTSGKLSLLEFDDFESNPLPLMKRRIKVNLRKLTYDLFEYGAEFPKPILYWKSRYLNEESPLYAEQSEFDEALDATGLLGDFEYGPKPEDLARALKDIRLKVKGMTLIQSDTIPELDSPCGANFTYRDFCECGETQNRLGFLNVPKRPETYNALHGLASNILDPVIDYFGGIKLTYGFCSHELGQQIKERVAPHLDQHASEEQKTSGVIICSRGGAACDFIVADEDMRDVANWIIDNLAFDRLYFYGTDRPLHVSWSAAPSSKAYEMCLTKSGKRIPRPFK